MVVATHVVYSSIESAKYPSMYWRITKRSDLFNHEHEQALVCERAKYMRNTGEKRKAFMVLVIACLEARWRRSDETWINASHPLCFSALWQRRKTYIERNGISGRVRMQARRRRIKLCFSGRIHEERTRDASVHSMPRIPDAAIRTAELAEKCSWKKRSLRLHEKASLSTDGSHEFWWISFPPAELSAGTTLICIMQFTCAHSFKIYT